MPLGPREKAQRDAQVQTQQTLPGATQPPPLAPIAPRLVALAVPFVTRMLDLYLRLNTP